MKVGVSFRRKKKAAREKGKHDAKEEKRLTKKAETTSDAAAATTETTKVSTPPRKKKSSKAAAVIPRSLSKEYSSPLTTITESHDEEHLHVIETPAAETSLLRSINVVTSVDESMEVVVGSANSKTSDMNQAMTGEPDVLLEQVKVFDEEHIVESETEEIAGNTNKHDDIRKALFQDEDVTVETEDTIEEDEAQVPVVSPEEPPFDVQADYGGIEDPAIMDLMQRAQRAEDELPDQSGSAQNSIASKNVVEPLEDEMTPPSMFKSDIRDANITKKLLAAFNCSMDTTEIHAPACKGMSAFYDTMCTTVRGKRPFFSEEFTRDFMEVRSLESRSSVGAARKCKI